MAKDFAGSMAWANSDAAGTVKTLENGDTSHTAGLAVVHVYNPSTETALTIQPQLVWEDDGGTERISDLGDTFSVPANSTAARMVDGLGMGKSRVKATNATAVGLTGAFTARVRVEFLG